MTENTTATQPPPAAPPIPRKPATDAGAVGAKPGDGGLTVAGAEYHLHRIAA